MIELVDAPEMTRQEIISEIARLQKMLFLIDMDIPPKLSGRQADIYRHLLLGKSNAEIASAIGITEKSVKQTLTIVFLKLGVKNRHSLIVKHFANSKKT